MDISETRCLELQFSKQLAGRVLTGLEIKGEGDTALEVALVNPLTNQVVNSGPLASSEIEIVALKGDFGDVQGGNWTSEQFNENIVTEREDIPVENEEFPKTRRKWPLLGGKTLLNLNKGKCYVKNIKFRHCRLWMKLSKFKLGARISSTHSGIQVKEALSDQFTVEDRRNKCNQKHYPPAPSDEVWRLENIAKTGATGKRLKREKVNYVKDFQTRLSKDPEELKRLVRLPEPKWGATVRHAQTCKPDNMVGQVPAPAPGDACNMLVASAHQDKGIHFDGNIMPSMDSPGVLTGLDVSDYPIVYSMEIRFDHPLNIPGQVTNNMICDIDSMTPAFYQDEHLQMFCSSNLGPSTDLRTAASGFRKRQHPPPRGQRRWKMLLTVLRWSSSINKVGRKKI